LDDPGGLSPRMGLTPPISNEERRNSGGFKRSGAGYMQRQLSRTSSCDKVKILHDTEHEQTEAHNMHHPQHHRKRLVKIRFKKSPSTVTLEQPYEGDPKSTSTLHPSDSSTTKHCHNAYATNWSSSPQRVHVCMPHAFYSHPKLPITVKLCVICVLYAII